MLVFSTKKAVKVLEARAVSRHGVSRIVTPRGVAWRWELSPHNARRKETRNVWSATKDH